jgi:PAS domain S-box-containing protein
MHDVTAQRSAEEARLEFAREQARRAEAEAASRMKDELINEIKLAEQRYRSFVTATTSVLWSADAHGNVMSVDDWGALTGQHAEGFKGMAWLEALHPEDRETTKRLWLEAIQNRTVYFSEHRVLTPDKTYRHLAARGVPILNEDGTVREWVGASTDITERKLAEARDRFLLTLDETVRQQTDADEIVATCARLLGEHLKADRCAYAEVEADQDSFLITGDYTGGNDVTSIVGHFKMSQFGSEALRLMRAGEAYVVADAETDQRVTPDDLRAYRQTQIRGVICVPLHKAGRFVAAMAVHQTTARNWSQAEVELVTTVTSRCWESIERARAVRSLRDSEARLSFMAESMPQKIFTATPTGEVVYFNRQWTDFTGLSFERIRDWGWLQFIHPDDVEENIRSWQHSINTGEPFQLEHRFRRADGEYRWHLSRAHAMRDAEGKVLMWTGSNTEIDDVKRTQEELREANRLKDEFLATLSHELRTPMTAILGWAHLLQSNKFDGAGYSRGLEVIQRNARAQVSLIDDLLDISRIITGKLRLNVRSVELASVITAAVDAVRPAAEAKGIRLQTLFDPQAGPVSGDADRLQQVIWNLLTNAVKFTPKHGRVQIRLERINSHIEITVSDTGKGIEPEFLPHVFDRFRQADQTSTRAMGGLGLGLAIVNQLSNSTAERLLPTAQA